LKEGAPALQYTPDGEDLRGALNAMVGGKVPGVRVKQKLCFADVVQDWAELNQRADVKRQELAFKNHALVTELPLGAHNRLTQPDLASLVVSAVKKGKEVIVRCETCHSEGILIGVKEELEGALTPEQLERVSLLATASGMNGTWSTKAVLKGGVWLGGMSQAARDLNRYRRFLAQLGEQLSDAFGAVNRMGLGAFCWVAIVGGGRAVEDVLC
jgi:hypothetical protein